MKKLVLFICLVPFIAAAQPYGWGFENCDTVSFDNSFPYNLRMDTAASCIWQHGNPSKSVFTSALTVSKCLVTDTVNTYPHSNKSSFIVDLQNDSSHSCYQYGIMQFIHSVNTDTLAGCYIEVSIDSSNWINIFNPIEPGFRYGIYKKNNFSPEPTGLQNIIPDTLFNGELGFKGNYDSDTMYMFFEYIVIKAYTFSPRFRFTFISDSLSQPNDGWMIDNIVFGSYMGWGSVNENLSHSINIYPNPVEDTFAFEVDEKRFKPVKYTITNVLGQQIASGNITTTYINTDDLPLGAYIITLIDKEGNSGAKLFYKQ